MATQAHENGTSILDQMICTKIVASRHDSIFQEQYSLAPTAIFSAQLLVISLASKFVDLWLQQLGQTSVVSQVIAGILLGPTWFGQYRAAARFLFPPDGYMALATLATFGNMFYHFLIAVRTDPMMILRPGRVPMVIATVAFSITLFFSIIMATLLKKYVEMNESLHNGLVLIAMTQAFTGISVVSYLITELKLQNTDVGRLSLAVAVFTDVLNVLTVTLIFVAEDKIRSHKTLFSLAFSTAFGIVFVIMLIIRPMILTLINYIPLGKTVDQKHVFFIIITALILGFMSEVIGQHYLFGPQIFGLLVPEGPPLGAALVARLDTFVSGFLYPTYLAINGLQTNLLKINPKEVWILGIIVIFAMMIKTGAVMVSGMYMKIPPKDAFVLSIILNAKGILEISIFNIWKANKILNQEEFSLCIMSVIVTTAVITPLIRYLYDPTTQNEPFKRNTLQHSKQDSELRMLVCLHNSDNVPTLVNLLEITKASEESCNIPNF